MFLTSPFSAVCPVKEFTLISNLIPIFLAEIKKPVMFCVEDSQILKDCYKIHTHIIAK